MRKRTVVDISLLILVLVGGFFAVTNATTIGDRVHSFTYTPPAEIVELADDAGMSELGRQLFYRFSPELVSEQKLLDVCLKKSVGCAVGSSIYILEHDDIREQNRSVVTAAHEMLHVAYSRLTDKDRSVVIDLIDRELGGAINQDINKQIQKFAGDDDVFYDEAHAYIGSEAELLSSELEKHYSKYFDNREMSVQAYRNSPLP